jgi:tight adherence protein C
MDMLLLAAIATFGSVVIAGTAVLSQAIERRRVSRTLRALPTSELRPDDLRGRTLAIPAAERLLRPTGKWLAGLARRLTPVAALERFDEKLVRAGRPAGWDPARLAAIRLIGRVVMPVIVYVVMTRIGLGAPQAIVLAIVSGLAMHIGPDALLDNMIGERQESIRAALPDVIDLMTITVEAGLGFDAALDRVARTTQGPLGDELRRTVRDMSLGRPRSEALRAWADRVNLPELRGLVSSLVQAEQFGITMGDVLRSQADELRERRRQRAEEHAQKMPVKILIPLIFLILPAMFVVLVGPGVLDLAEALG